MLGRPPIFGGEKQKCTRNSCTINLRVPNQARRPSRRRDFGVKGVLGFAFKAFKTFEGESRGRAPTEGSEALTRKDEGGFEAFEAFEGSTSLSFKASKPSSPSKPPLFSFSKP